jgi:hypothetical protein
MTIETLLCHLEAEKERTTVELQDYYEKTKETAKEIKRFYEDPFVSPEEIPKDLMQKHAEYYHYYSATHYTLNRIIDTISIIKERVGE